MPVNGKINVPAVDVSDMGYRGEPETSSLSGRVLRLAASLNKVVVCFKGALMFRRGREMNFTWGIRGLSSRQ